MLLNRTMARIGLLAATGKALPPDLLATVDEVAAKSPLATQPFLIKGAVAQTEGRENAAERLYFEARARDPRSRAARYFFAERLLRRGRVGPALLEMAAFSRLTGGSGVFAPALASFAQTPGAVPQLRRFFKASPEFEAPVLSQLATEPRNLGLILALWSGQRASAGESPPDWLVRMIAELFQAGEFAKAHALWRWYSRVEQGQAGLFNPEFRTLAAPPPFNWSYGSSGGVAEPSGNGRLQIIYYGRADAVLAEQVLTLAPGPYQLGMRLSGDLKSAASVAWVVKCLPQDRPIVRQPIQHGRSPVEVRVSFTVPSGCPAQRLQLAAEAGDFPKTSEFTVSNLQLGKASAR